MNVRHADKKLERLEVEADYAAGFDRAIVRAYRKVMQYVRAADNELALYRLKSLHYEKLKGDRKHERSVRLNKQFRLILRLVEEGGKTVVVVSIEDYH